MSTDSSPARTSVHLPLGLLAISIAIFFWSQLGAASQAKKTINWQLGNLDKQDEQLKDAQKQFADALVKRDELVKQSSQIQQQYTALLNDVLELSATDADAKRIVEKWKIQRNAPPADATAEGEKKPEEAKPEEKKPDAK